MEVERKRSKGGFFQLFDWNGKSRKKLFASNSDFSGSKQVNESVKSFPGQHHFTEADNVGSPSNRCSSDYNCVSSVASDEGYGSRPPGVVARLMGLDFLPTPNLPEPCPAPFPEYPSLRVYHETQATLQSFSSNGEESRLGKMQNRAIERFHTETLPPKSAKSIPSTHHKLLSPIKGPRFGPTRNAAYIMEAAAKIIEASPQSANGKISSIVSSSVPLRIRDMKKKMETAQKTPRPQRPKEHTAVRYTKGQLSSETKDPENVKNKGKSVSLASQAKFNVKRNEGLASTSNRSLTNQREQNELTSKSNPRKRNPTCRSNNVLRQNNIKQNCASNKSSLASKASASGQQTKKPAPPTNGIVGSNRTVSKVFINSESGSRNTKPLSSKTKNFPRKGSVKRGNQVRDSVANSESPSTDKSSSYDADGSEKGMDVVSFTFTSPLKKPMHDDSFGDSDQSYSNYSTSSSPRSNVIGSDTLSLLLDQKLRELAHRVECSHSKPWSSSSTSSLQDSVSMINVIVPTSREHRKSFQPGGVYGCDCPTIDDQVSVDEKWQGSEECSTSSNYNESAKELSCRRPLYISNLESSYFVGSDRENRNGNSRGEKDCLFVHSQEPSISVSTCQSVTVEGETELSDSASSISNLDSRLTHAKKPDNWEIEYLKNILKPELRLKDFLSGLTDNVISPDLFDHLENQETKMGRDMGEQSKLGRKLFFDCALERLALRCKLRLRTWEMLVNGKDSLAEQLHRDISGLRDMGELMVDELVDRDMSTGRGRWLGFDMEALEEGMEVEKAILSSLIHELVIDFMF